jgi:uncharacterized membrane protein
LTQTIPPVPFTKPRPPHRAWFWLSLILMVAYIVVFSALALLRHERYNSTAFDLAFYDQVLWNTSQARWMQYSVGGANEYESNFISHVEPILFIVAPFKLIFAEERWLLILQTLIIASGAVPVYRIALRTWKRGWAGSLFALLYLLYPTVGWSNLFDIHPITFSTPLLLWAYDQLEEKRYPVCSLCLLLALFCKEEMGIVIACFGLYAWLIQKWRGGLFWFVFGWAWAILSFFVIIPAAQGSGLAYQATLRYEWLFRGTLNDKIAYLLSDDSRIKLEFLFRLFLPLAFTPLLRPMIVFIGSPAIALSLLSMNMNQNSVYHHYMMNVVPFLLIAAIKGIHGLRRGKTFIRVNLAQRTAFTFCILMTLGLFAFFGPLAYTPKAPFAPIYTIQQEASLIGLRAAEALLDDSACLTASNNIAAHYGQRRILHVIGVGNYTQCNRILVDLADDRFVSFGVPQVYACQQFEAGFTPIFYQDNVLMLQKDAPPARVDAGAVRAACEQWRDKPFRP